MNDDIFGIYIYTYGSVPWEEMYKDDPRVWHAIFEMICQHFSDLEKTGIDLGEPNGRVYPSSLETKGTGHTWFLGSN